MQMFGKYRGRVLDVEDPQGLGRIRAEVLALQGVELGWALPCIPGAGPGSGHLVLPPAGASVWIEFEAGALDVPIWSGGFWQDGEAPATVERQPS
jgi:hypothetical protein